MSDLLPTHIWSDILIRVPVRALLSLKCVCTTFRSIIDDSDFTILHFTRNCNNSNSCDEGIHNLLLIERPIDKGFIRGGKYVGRCLDTLTQTLKFDIPIDWGYGCEVVGSVNGLLLMVIYKSLTNNWVSNEIILWNPSIRKSLKIPPCPTSQFWDSVNLGFGYDLVNNDYKIVAIAEENDDHDVRLFEVYSVRTGSWRNMGVDGSAWCLLLERHVYLNGAIHWVEGNRYIDDGGIVSFNLSTESFSYSEFPFNGLLILDDERRVNVPVLANGSLAVVSITRELCFLWIKEDEGWTNGGNWSSQHQMHSCLRSDRISNAFFSKENNELLVCLHGQGLVSYNFESSQMTHHHPRAIFVDNYKESMFWRELLPPRGNNNE